LAVHINSPHGHDQTPVLPDRGGRLTSGTQRSFSGNSRTYDPLPKPASSNWSKTTDELAGQRRRASDTVNTLFVASRLHAEVPSRKKGEDVTALAVRTTIKERPKKTRRMKKASVTEAEAAK